MKTLLLIDAYAMIYRAYYAFIRAPRMNSRGENTSAIFGFVVTLEDLIKRVKPSHLAVAFDPAGPTFRHEAFEQYKAQRQETPEDIRWAVPRIKQLLQAMNIPILQVDGYEADDVIGTLAHQAEKEGFEVYMATPDKDYGQLVTEHVFMFRPRHTGGFEKMGPQEVCEKYGLQTQAQVVDLLGLMGDSSDNIPGCKGVGEKTAVQLLQQFGSIENLLANTDQLKGALQRKVQEQVDNIRFSKFLATIKTDVPITFDAPSLVCQEKDWERLAPLYRELEFNSLLKQAPASIANSPLPITKATKKAKPQEATLDLFASVETDPLSGGYEEDNGWIAKEETVSQDSIEGRLVSYLLNPEVAYNPSQPIQWEVLKADSALWNLYQEVELPLSAVLREMEQAGVRIDVDMLKQAEEQLNAELQVLEQQIYTAAETTFNINSPKQVGEVLFDQLKLDAKAKKSKTGQYSTSEEVLLGLKGKHEVVGMILEYRELKKLISTYISALPTYINAETGKIHTTYNQTVTATGRLSSSNPNLQNLPIRSERGQLIRQAVIPDQGCVFLSADYSQIELRLMAHFSQDPHLVEAFRSGQDIHAATAAKIFNVPIEQVTKDQRRQAKTANFGIIYGISAFGLAQQLDCSRSEAKALIDGYFAAFPGVIDYIERQKALAREQGYAITLFGRKRYLPDILSHNATVRSFAERNAVNSPIQGTAADIIKMAMVTIHRRLKDEGLKAQMIMQVHDELNFNVPMNEVDKVREIVVSEMQNVVHLTVPLIADCGVGKNWLEAH
ncbi:MAG: DNA polymerase I [Paludibacteraceae bacterium]|nr:DNA polymerase I [Paludibacteraceae bacterium]MBP3575970.1 DNA polymerase I [Paludibacteraceae bacterium]